MIRSETYGLHGLPRFDEKLAGQAVYDGDRRGTQTGHRRACGAANCPNLHSDNRVPVHGTDPRERCPFNEYEVRWEDGTTTWVHGNRLGSDPTGQGRRGWHVVPVR